MTDNVYCCLTQAANGQAFSLNRHYLGSSIIFLACNLFSRVYENNFPAHRTHYYTVHRTEDLELYAHRRIHGSICEHSDERD